MRRPITNVAVQNNERWPITRLVKDVYGVLDALDIVGVAYTQNIPSISQKSRLDVLCKSDARIALDDDVVVVVDPAEVVEPQVRCQRRRFRRAAFHHAAVSTNGIDVVIEDLEAGPVVTVREPLLGDAHSDTCSDPLPKWTRRGLNTRDPVIFGMSWCPAVELAEV